MRQNLKALSPKDVLAIYPAIAGSTAVLANWRCKKKGPRFFRMGRKIVYRPEDIEAFLFKNPVLTIDSVEADR